MRQIDGSPYQGRHVPRMLIVAGGPRFSLQKTPSITHALLLSTLSPFHRFLCAVVINPALNWLYSSLRTARHSRLAYVIAMHYLYAVRVTVPQGFPWYCLLQWGFGYVRRYCRSSYTRHMSRKPWFDYRQGQHTYLVVKTCSPALESNQPNVHMWKDLKRTGCKTNPSLSTSSVCSKCAYIY
jgi:hypothetical protein